MPPDRAQAILEDIRDPASFILEAAMNKGREDYSQDRMLRQAVERDFEIITEAMQRLIRESPETARRISEHERIIAFRNILVHGYDLVDDELVWDTIKEKVPILLEEVEKATENRSP